MTALSAISTIFALTFFAMLTLAPSSASAHALAPSGLTLTEERVTDDAVPGASREGATSVGATWRRSRQSPRGERLELRLPQACTIERAGVLEDSPYAQTVDYDLSCVGGLAGQQIAVDGLVERGTNVVVQVTLSDGETIQALLDARSPAFTIPETQRAGAVFGPFVKMGAAHLLEGIDHILFLLGLLILVQSAGSLVAAVTAFTIGHGVSLVVTVVSPFAMPGPPVELGIALSIVVLGLRILKEDEEGRPPWTARQAALLCAGFGLLHGLGLAGAFMETGVSGDALPLAVAGFNVGVEIGQLVVVGAVLLLRPLIERAAGRDRMRLASAYLIGVSAAYWAIERTIAVASWALS